MRVGPALWGLSITGGPGHTALSLRPQLALPPPALLVLPALCRHSWDLLVPSCQPWPQPLPTSPAC